MLNKNDRVTFDEILIIAGPSCAGKSHLIKKMKANQPCDFFYGISFANNHPPLYVTINQYKKLEHKHYPAIVLHIDLLRLDKFEDQMNQIFSKGEHEVVVITICANKKTLLFRSWKRTKQVWIKKSMDRRKRRVLIEKLFYKCKRYLSSKSVFKIYSIWFERLERYSIDEHYLLDGNRSDVGDLLVYSTTLYKSLVGFKPYTQTTLA